MVNDQLSQIEETDLVIDWHALTEGLPDDRADWLPFLVFGMPYNKIAEIFGIDKSTITHALKGDTGRGSSELGRAVALGRKMVKRQLHYVWLDQKAVQAWRNVDYFLNIDPFATDESGGYLYDCSMQRTIFVEKAKMTKFILSQLGLHVQRYEVTHNVPEPMFRGDESLARIVIDTVTSAMKNDTGQSVEKMLLAEGVIDGEYRPLRLSDDEKSIELDHTKPGELPSSDEYFGNKDQI